MQISSTYMFKETSVSKFECHCSFGLHFFESSGADPGFLEKGFICIKGWAFAVTILSFLS